ncbi:response regulator [Piscinibacter sakaiensis]|uniref:Putative response regulator n=1 Tax=Piscinibacter sakaiensis TaxID=1547922 RepID=A0A0K8NTS4_PISS1|nr:response regulator [Piscinibacter sakaiensis]GAP33763.1 putative response regulator [Piscinibacter sakaiensis]
MANKGKILVVDDDRLVLATLSHGLSQAGYDVIDTDNGDDAILMAREHKPDLALLDIRMEGMSGFDVANYLRDYCQMPFMFLSAFSDDETVQHVKELGAVAYLVKPLDIRQIVPAVEAAFASIQGRAQQVGAAHRRVERLPASNEPLAPTVAMAVGVLMHRHSLSRTAALARLNAMAEGEGRALADQAERLLVAVEVFAVSSGG